MPCPCPPCALPKLIFTSPSHTGPHLRDVKVKRLYSPLAMFPVCPYCLAFLFCTCVVTNTGRCPLCRLVCDLLAATKRWSRAVTRLCMTFLSFRPFIDEGCTDKFYESFHVEFSSRIVGNKNPTRCVPLRIIRSLVGELIVVGTC